MAWLFSKRCKQVLKEKKLKVSIPLPVRVRIWTLINNYNETCEETTDTGYNYQTTILEKLPGKIKAELGCELLAFPKEGGDAKPSNLEGFIFRGNYPPYLFDTLELFYESISQNTQNQFQHDLNIIMEENDLSWRMADGKIFPVDSGYIEEEIIRKSYSLLHEVKFQGALQEFEKARADFANNDLEGAIQNANLAIESVIKEILGLEKAKPGELFKKLIDSGIIPEYYNGFLGAFERNILRCVSIMRNEEPSIGHGRGPQARQIPPSLAELGIHLSAVIINFLIKHYLVSTGKESKKGEILYDEDVPI
jgi:hypothetical protein